MYHWKLHDFVETVVVEQNRLIQICDPGDGDRRQVEAGFVNEVTDSRNQGGRKGLWSRGAHRCSIYLVY